jgi:hypothetical protein
VSERQPAVRLRLPALPGAPGSDDRERACKVTDAADLFLARLTRDDQDARESAAVYLISMAQGRVLTARRSRSFLVMADQPEPDQPA